MVGVLKKGIGVLKKGIGVWKKALFGDYEYMSDDSSVAPKKRESSNTACDRCAASVHTLGGVWRCGNGLTDSPRSSCWCEEHGLDSWIMARMNLVILLIVAWIFLTFAGGVMFGDIALAISMLLVFATLIGMVCLMLYHVFKNLVI